MAIVIRGHKYSCIDEACSKFNIEYDEVRQFARRHGVDTETALLHMVGGIARESELDKFVDKRSIVDTVQELTERRREAKPIISNKLDDWRTIARTNDSYSEGVESKAIVALTKLLAARSFLFDIDDVQSLKWSMLDRRKKDVRDDIAEKVRKLHKEIDRLTVEVQVNLENVPYSNLFMNCAKIALAGAAEELAAKRFAEFELEIRGRSGGFIDKAKIRQQRIDAELSVPEKSGECYTGEELAYIKKKEIQERLRVKQDDERRRREAERLKKEREAREAEERAERMSELALKKAKKFTEKIWWGREKYIRDISISDWESICIATVDRPVTIEEMRRLRCYALTVLNIHKRKHIEHVKKKLYKAMQEGRSPETMRILYSDKLYTSDIAIIPDKDRLILELRELAKKNKKQLEDKRVYKDSFQSAVSMLLGDKSHREKFQGYLEKGMNSREAIKLILGPEEYRRIEDSYDASDICKALGIPELTVIKRVEWLASREENMDDFKYTLLWDIAITDIYNRNRGK